MPSNGDTTAHAYVVPSASFVSFEHPFAVENVDKCLATFGGEKEMIKLLNPTEQDKLFGTPARLHLRPEDPFSKPVASIPISTQNILLKITVPKRIGRKRKQRSSEPFRDELNRETQTEEKSEPQGAVRVKRIDSNLLRRSLHDNAGNYQVEAVGSVALTHRWREIPDFVYSTSQSRLATEFRNKILTYEYPKVKNFNLASTITPECSDDLIPPPIFSNHTLPYIYSFRQNPAFRQTLTPAGTVTAVNTQAPPKIATHIVPSDVYPVPTELPAEAAPLSTLHPKIRTLVSQIETLLNQRPVWTRRGLLNAIPDPSLHYLAKHAIPYAGYVFRSGPWRDCIVKYGVDPRSDPSYRVYQTLIFKLDKTTNFGANTSTRPITGHKQWSRLPQKRPGTGHPDSHLFDGQSLNKDGKTWAICDVTDPLIVSIFNTTNIRIECDLVSDGWFHNGTLAKAKVIMRAKIARLLEGRGYSDVEFGRLLSIPEHITEENRKTSMIAKDASSEELTWAARIRQWALKSPASKIPRLDKDGKVVKVTQAVAGAGEDGEGPREEEEGDKEDDEDEDDIESEEEVEDEELENMEDDDDDQDEGDGYGDDEMQDAVEDQRGDADGDENVE